MMGLAGYDATRYLRQSMLVLALDDAAGRLIANSGNSAAMSLYQAARAESQTRASYQAIGANATKWVPLIKIAFESLYYGSFPLAMLLMMTPMAMAVAKGYFGGFVWLATWEPMSSIMHTMLMKSATGFYREHTTTLSGAGSTDVLNWANHLGVQAVEQDVGVTAGYLMMSVPFLSFAIFFGATKMAGMATSMLNVSQGAAIDTGREASTGSLSLGTTSMNNMNANTWNTSASMDRGRSSQSLADGGMVTTNRDGSQTFAAGSAQSNVGMTATVGQAVREEVSDRASDARRQVETQSQDFTQSLTTTSSQLSDFGRSASESRTAGGDVSWTGTEDQKQSATQAWSEVEKFAETHNLSTDLAMSAIVAGTLGTPPGGLSAQLSANGSLNASSRESFETAVAASQSGDYSSTVSTLISSSERASTGMSSSQGETASNSVRSNYDDMTQQAQRLSRSTEEARTLERADAYLQSQDMAYNQQITDAVIGELQAYSASKKSSESSCPTLSAILG
jgi:conjugal transfer mating pair stabilization protein TraG